MPTSYKSHGSWSRYEPTADQIPDTTPPGVMYCKRDNDGVDWYAYSRDPSNFTDGGVKLVLTPMNGLILVSASSTDPQRLFPQGATVLEVIGFEGDPQQFDHKIVDLANDTFTDPPVRLITEKGDIWRRCTDTEADTLSNLLASLPARKRNLYNDCQYLDHSDPFYTELYAAVAQAITPARADVVLAAS